SVEDLLKSVVIASANDAAVALAEAVAGSVPAFVTRMNQKAERLGMTNTHFENVTGLDDTATNHLTSAHDIAVMSRALISHEEILPYSSTWMDSIRNGEFGLTNTNRLVRFYPGCNGLKTGSTAKAGFCISATAERDGLSLICVIMGAESRDVRNHAASTLLDWGFAEYGLYTSDEEELAPIVLQGGTVPFAAVKKDRFSCVVPKQLCGRVEMRINLPDALSAPISAGEPIGCAEFLLEGRVIGNVPIVAGESVMRIDLFSILRKLAAKFLLI
ncbi:MAG: D-alanyl-D-alanine carboxypeptidase, partial [Clostridia bacterium]|nr:D-alanyl-D-alanine carboxypeptidase [Clostridia bacterium]